MLLKEKNKKQTVLQLTALFLVMAFAIVIAACPGDDVGGKQQGEQEIAEIPKNYVSGEDALTWGIEAAPVTLGLTPGNDTTEIKLNWYSNGITNPVAKVRFVKGTFAQGTKLIDPELDNYSSIVDSAVSDASSGNKAHKVTVKGLEPGSSYQYAVSSDGANWSEAYDFKIPAKTGAFKFAVIADPQLTTGNVDTNSRYLQGSTTAAGWLETMSIIVQKGVSFIASGGDQVDKSAGDEAEYNNFFAPDGLRNLPFAPVSGNHDNHLHFNYHYNLPNAQTFEDETVPTAAGRNYFYIYNNILFVVLNTAPYPTASGEKDVTTAKLHTNRFDKTIAAAIAKFPKTGDSNGNNKWDWLIVQHHKSTASVANHIADKDIQAYVEAGFETIMSKYNVDFVITGHDHVYARSWPLEGKDNGKVSVPVKTGGTNDNHEFNNPGKPIYLTFTTASGLKYYQVSSDKTFPYNDNPVNNTEYPYLGNVTDQSGTSSTAVGTAAYKGPPAMLPVSNLAFVQPWIPSYCIVEVDGKTIKFSTYAIATVAGNHTEGTTEAFSFNKDEPYDWVRVTKN